MRLVLRPQSIRAMAAVGASVFALTATAATAFADVAAVGGGAFGESVQVTTLLPSHIASGPTPTVTLPATGGGPLTKQLAGVNLFGMFSAGLMSVATQGSLGPSGSATSSASVAGINVLAGRLTVDLISSQCRADGSGSSGSSTIAGLKIDGHPVSFGASPNQVLVNAAGLKVVINEQVKHDMPNIADIKVNAVHVSLTGALGTGSIIIAQSRCHAEGPNVIIPEAPYAFLMPLTGGLVIIGVVFLARRRETDLV